MKIGLIIYCLLINITHTHCINSKKERLWSKDKWRTLNTPVEREFKICKFDFHERSSLTK